MTTLSKVLKRHKEICDSARKLIEQKGHDYNRAQQNSGDTLFNLRTPYILGAHDTPTQQILGLLCNKTMRLISLTKDPSVNPKFVKEKVKDTIEDLINYGVYLEIFYDEARSNDNKGPTLLDVS